MLSHWNDSICNAWISIVSKNVEVKYILLLLCTSDKHFANPYNFYECINTRNDDITPEP